MNTAVRAAEESAARIQSRPLFLRTTDVVIGAVILLAGLLIVPAAYDPFHQPKLLVFHGSGLILLATMGVALLFGALRLSELYQTRMDALPAAIVAWSILTAGLAVHRPTAFFAVLTALSAATLFAATRWRANDYSPLVLLLLLVPAAINSVLLILQELKIWNEIAPLSARPIHAGTTGLIGNPNHAGSYLVPAVIAAAAWILATRKPLMRVVLTAMVILIMAGIFASRTRGAILGAFVGLAALALVRWRWIALKRVIIATILLILAAATSAPILERLFDTEIEALFSGRLTAYAAAWAMFLESPVFGVGPGCFGYAYFDYATRVYPAMLDYSIAGQQLIFGEAHNDHLQIAAENGLPGYLLFVGSLLYVGSISRRVEIAEETESSRFARLGAAPLVASLAALCVFQFPLYLAASLVAFVFVAALIVGWSRDAIAA